jgi:hypothetical protein
VVLLAAHRPEAPGEDPAAGAKQIIADALGVSIQCRRQHDDPDSCRLLVAESVYIVATLMPGPESRARPPGAAWHSMSTREPLSHIAQPVPELPVTDV